MLIGVCRFYQSYYPVIAVCTSAVNRQPVDKRSASKCRPKASGNSDVLVASGWQRSPLLLGGVRSATGLYLCVTGDLNSKVGFYFTWPLRKKAAYKKATRGPTALTPFRGTRQ